MQSPKFNQNLVRRRYTSKPCNCKLSDRLTEGRITKYWILVCKNHGSVSLLPMKKEGEADDKS